MHRQNKKNRKISLIVLTSENEVLSSLIMYSASLLIEKRACAKVQKRNEACGIFLDLFSKLMSYKESFNNIVHHRAITRGNMVLFLRNKRFDTLFLFDYQLRWWILPIEECACRKTRFGWWWLLIEDFLTPPWLQHNPYYFKFKWKKKLN